MAYKLINEEYSHYSTDEVCEFICDTDADFANLPECSTGSTAVSVATGNIRVVNASGVWVKFGG